MSKSEKKQFLKKVNFKNVNFQIKISDFGLSKLTEPKEKFESTNACGTPCYMSPQMHVGATYTNKCDIWSFGIIFYELLTGTPPYMGKDLDEFKRKLHIGAYKIPKFVNISIEGIMLLNSCLKQMEIDRIDSEKLILHKYLVAD